MKKLFLLISALFFTLYLSASPIGEKKAREIAGKFFALHSTRAANAELKLEWAGSNVMKEKTRSGSAEDVDEALIYIFNRVDSEGFVIVSGDNNSKPIIAFSNDSSFNVDDMPDAARWMLSCWCRQVAADRELPDSGADVTRADDLWAGNEVLLIPTAKWNQGEPYNREAPLWPEGRCVTGCVATAMSITAKYYEWPDKGVGTVPSYKYDSGNKTIPDNVLGREYNWPMMLMEYKKNKYSDIQGNAVAALMYDIGTAITMGYSPTGSGAVTANSPKVLSKYFKYGKGATWMNNGVYTYLEWAKLIAENLHNYGPTIGAGGGHAYVLDGYTDKYYIHVNFGWGGSSDGYYYLPDNGMTASMGACFYLEPDPDGTSIGRDHLQFVNVGGGDPWTPSRFGIESETTLFKTGEEFKMRFTWIKNNSQSAFEGSIKFVMCDEQGNEIEVLKTYDCVSKTIPVGKCLHDIYTVGEKYTITKPIKEGYRLRYYYKGKNPGTWQWVRKSSADGVDELILCASPEYLQKHTGIEFDASTKVCKFHSLLALNYVVKNEAGEVVASGKMPGGQYYNQFTKKGAKIDMSKFERGEYTIALSLGSDPYEIKIIL